MTALPGFSTKSNNMGISKTAIISDRRITVSYISNFISVKLMATCGENANHLQSRPHGLFDESAAAPALPVTAGAFSYRHPRCPEQG